MIIRRLLVFLAKQYWDVPPHNNSGKWRFSLGYTTKDAIMWAVTVTGRGEHPIMGSDRIMGKKRILLPQQSACGWIFRNYVFHERLTNHENAIKIRFSRSFGFSFHNSILPIATLVSFKSGWFCPEWNFPNYGRKIRREETQLLRLCNFAHTSRTAQRLFPIDNLGGILHFLLYADRIMEKKYGKTCIRKAGLTFS